VNSLLTWAVVLFADVSPAPAPTAIRQVDPNKVTPGMWGFISLLVLIAAAVGLYFSLRKQLGKVDFEEGGKPAGVRDVDVFPRRTSDGLDLRDNSAAQRGGTGGTGPDTGLDGDGIPPSSGS